MPGKKIFFAALVLLAVPPAAYAFDGNGGAIDVNFIEILESAASDANGGTISVGFILGESQSGIWNSASPDAGVQLGVYFDQNLPSVTISSPASGSSTTSTTASLAFEVAPGGNPIAKHFIRIDSADWIDNAFSKAYTFSGLSTGTHTIYVIANDAFDLNSATASTTFTITAAGGGTGGTGGSGGTGGTDSGGGGGSGGGSGKKTQTILDNPLNLVKKIYYEGGEFTTKEGYVAKRWGIWRLISVGGGVNASYYTLVINIKNPTGTTFTNIAIKEEINKEFADHVKRISFEPEPDEIITPDPVVEWLLKEVPPGTDLNILYTVNGLSDKSLSERFGDFVKELGSPEALISTQAPPEEGEEPGKIVIKTPIGAIVLPEITLPKIEPIVTAAITVVVIVAWAASSLFFAFYRRKRKGPWGLGG